MRGQGRPEKRGNKSHGGETNTIKDTQSWQDTKDVACLERRRVQRRELKASTTVREGPGEQEKGVERQPVELRSRHSYGYTHTHIYTQKPEGKNSASRSYMFVPQRLLLFAYGSRTHDTETSRVDSSELVSSLRR